MTINSIAQNRMGDAMLKISTMKRINSAADDAAGLAITEKLESQIEGLSKGMENTQDMQNLLKTAEGGLSNVEDSLQRIRELSMQAANGIYNDDDRALIQNEINQLTEGISEIGNNTQFNNINLLDGSFTDKHTASSADGSGVDVTLPNISALAESLQGYDVTGDFDINTIDNAISAVSSARSSIGAMTNRMDHTIDSSSVMLLNQMAAKSRMVDLDVAKGSSELSKERVLNELQLFNVKQQKELMKTSLSVVL